MTIANNRKLEFSAGMGICITIIAACIAYVSKAEAITFDGETSGIFDNPAGLPGMVANGVGTDTFSWGTAVQPSTQSELKFAGASFTGILTDQSFTLGNLNYVNGTLLAGTEATSVDLLATLKFTSPVGLTQNLNVALQLLNTPNTGTNDENADSAFFTALLPTITFTFDGIEYTLITEFGTVTGPGFTKIFEDASASAELVGIITAVPDSGSTLALMAMAVVGLGGLRQYLARKDL